MTLDAKVMLEIAESVDRLIPDDEYTDKWLLAFAAAIESRCREGWEKELGEPVAWGGYSGVGEWIVCKSQIYPWLTEPLYTRTAAAQESTLIQSQAGATPAPAAVTVDAAPGSTSPGLPISGGFRTVEKWIWVNGVLSAAAPTFDQFSQEEVNRRAQVLRLEGMEIAIECVEDAGGDNEAYHADAIRAEIARRKG